MQATTNLEYAQLESVTEREIPGPLEIGPVPRAQVFAVHVLWVV